MVSPGKQIEKLREDIQDTEDGRTIDREEDREALIKFSDQLYLMNSQYGDHRHLKLLRHCTRMAENVGGLMQAVEDRDQAEDIVRWIHETYPNEETNRDYRIALRMFGKRVTRSDEPPEGVAWVDGTTSNSYNPVPSEADMLEWESDVLPMIDSCNNARDKALIAVQFDAGLRGGELIELRIGDIFDADHSIGLHVDGKNGERSVHLIPSIPYLQQWLKDHPARDDPNAPLWSKLNTAERPVYQTLLGCFKRAARRAGVNKPVTLTDFRKSNMRWLVQKGMGQAHIEDRQGRKRGSESTARYLARFGDESSEKRYAALHGKEIETEGETEIAPLTCPRCDKETPRSEDFCMWCSQALSSDATERIESVEDTTVDHMVKVEDEAERRLLAKFREFVRSKPNALPDDAHELLSSSS